MDYKNFRPSGASSNIDPVDNYQAEFKSGQNDELFDESDDDYDKFRPTQCSSDVDQPGDNNHNPSSDLFSLSSNDPNPWEINIIKSDIFANEFSDIFNNSTNLDIDEISDQEKDCFMGDSSNSSVSNTDLNTIEQLINEDMKLEKQGEEIILQSSLSELNEQSSDDIEIINDDYSSRNEQLSESDKKYIIKLSENLDNMNNRPQVVHKIQSKKKTPTFKIRVSKYVKLKQDSKLIKKSIQNRKRKVFEKNVDISSNDEMFLIEIPQSIDPKSLSKCKFDLNETTFLDINGIKYETRMHKQDHHITLALNNGKLIRRQVKRAMRISQSLE